MRRRSRTAALGRNGGHMWKEDVVCVCIVSEFARGQRRQISAATRIQKKHCSCSGSSSNNSNNNSINQRAHERSQK